MTQQAAAGAPALSAGFALPAVAARVSAAAGAMRAAAINASLGSVELPLPRAPVDQRAINCCVSCALGAAMEIVDPGSPSLAPLFHYYVTRFERFGALPDGSLDLSIALVALSAAGICRRDLHVAAFDERGVSTRPSAAAVADGRGRALGLRGLLPRYRPVTIASRAAWAREQLQLGRPVVIGFILPTTYTNELHNRNFVWRDPEALPLSNSGHCVVATGFNDANQALHIRDSRGGDAFDAGYWWLGYRVADSRIVQSMYSIIP
jgi:hypothetical protein